ncbi:hypothetical protein FE257_008684 [Aspergillus nanangensis]|uniref:SET domain-containing protein n=1 Tax=Aspergillus nanangensis TaxID=2582783 RepID=A0AAD4CL28_ASPNN|nr:hypothetical protein FE257_008684 [Aspergillus nanangensis]
MKADWRPGEEHEQFTKWAISQEIIVNGVAPARFPGRGLGMIATRNIEEDETIVTVPLKEMLTIERVPDTLRSKFPDGTSVHAILAAFLTNGDTKDLEEYELWRKTWPTRQDFEDSMPILWPHSVKGFNSRDSNHLLPPSISGTWNNIPKSKIEYEYETFHQNLLAQQEERLRDAWESVVSVFPETDWDNFSFHWLIVNTRSFHYLMPGQEPPEDRNDAMALLPFADYFNHSDVACNVNFDGKEYVFKTTKSYEEGEEIYMSYGPHPNDFLLTEYGFYLDENESEVIYLDDIIFKEIPGHYQEELNFQQYYGNYEVTTTGACYRTEIAACISYMELEDWRNYVLGHSVKGVNADRTVSVIKKWIKTYADEARATTSLLKLAASSEEGSKNQKKLETLLRRWEQIEDLCSKATDAVSC